MFKFLKKAFESFAKKTVQAEEPAEKPEAQAKPKEDKKEKPGFFVGIGKFLSEVTLSEESFNKLFSDLELELLQNNVAVDVIEKIKGTLKLNLVGKSIKRTDLAKKVREDLKNSLLIVFEKPAPVHLAQLAARNKPLILLFVGVNGVGKTTSMAKVAKWLQGKGLSCVFAASDTFRAASIEQLEAHADKLGIKLIKHDYGADPAAVAFDAVKHAQAKAIDVVLIDTAGRQHANVDLMAELQKVKRVVKPHLTILVVDALTGNDAVEQAKMFNEKIGIDGSILAKVDTDEKGGALVSVAYTTSKPIIFLGTGQRYEDLQEFNSKEIVEKIV